MTATKQNQSGVSSDDRCETEKNILIPWFDDILEGERFGKDRNIPNEFDRAAGQTADRTTSFFLNQVARFGPQVPSASELDRIASNLDHDLLKEVCSPTTPWLKPILSGSEAEKQKTSEALVDTLRTFLPPTMLPVEAMIYNDLSPLRQGLMAALGTFLGFLLATYCFANLTYCFANLYGIVFERMIALLGAMVGGGCFVIASHYLGQRDALRKKIFWILGAIAVADGVVSMLCGLHPALWMVIGEAIVSGLGLRICCYLIGMFFLHLARPNVRLEPERARDIFHRLFLMRVESLVMILGLFEKGNVIQSDNLELFELQHRVSALQAELDTSDKGMCRMAALVETIWKADIRRLPLLLQELSRQLALRKYELGYSEPPAFEKQIPSDLSGDPYEWEEQRILIWDDSMTTLYEPIEYVRSGDEVMVEREPVFREGQVVVVGMVTKKRSERV